MNRKSAAALVLLVCAGLGRAQSPAPYHPARHLHGVIRSWGSEEMAPLMAVWERGFAKRQPEVLFLDTLKGSESAQAALYTEVADLALMNRETYLTERYGLWVRKRRYPLEITVARGSPDRADRSFALAILVNKENPLAGLSMKQLDGIFGADRSGGWDSVKFAWHTDVARGAEGNLRTWGQLGLEGAWASQPIRPYGYPLTAYAASAKEQGAMLFFRTHVLSGADKWNFSIQEYEKGAEIAAAVARDRFGIGYGPLGEANPGVKAIPIAAPEGGAAVPLSKETVSNGSYPLTRSVFICIDREPGKPVNPNVAEFLEYVLSEDGQRDVAQEGGYCALDAAAAARERRKIE